MCGRKGIELTATIAGEVESDRWPPAFIKAQKRFAKVCIASAKP